MLNWFISKTIEAYTSIKMKYGSTFKVENVDKSVTTMTLTELKTLSGMLATTAEINRTCDVSTRIVNVTASTLTVTEALHDNKIVTLNRAAGITTTLPAATGSGAKFRFLIGTTVTSNTTVIKVANASDAFQGFSQIVSDDTAAVKGFIATAGTDDTITLNGTTTGGYVGDIIEVQDVATNRFQVQVTGKATGTEATPFSATV